MKAIKEKILELVESQSLSPRDGAALLRTVKESDSERTKRKIAVIGIGCRFQDADNPMEYWTNLQKGSNLIGKFPESRRTDVNKLFDMSRQEEIYSNGTYLKEIDKFDAGYFHLSAAEASYMDPVQRIMLETAYSAFEDAGYGWDRIYGTNTGVYIGNDHTGGQSYMEHFVQEADSLVLTGSYTGILSSRISYILNLTGPSIVTDTACSSGLTAVHTACSAILENDCHMALAGGINIKVLPVEDGSLKVVESSNNAVKTFDKHANGTVWGEGAGAVLLKEYDQAVKDNDYIYGVILASVLNNDGASNGITAPNAEAQEKAISRAWDMAGINPETITYIETHGTGTVLGDPIEIKAIAKAFRRTTDKRQFCGVGSVKTNMGHLVGCSGIASLIKVLLALKHKKLPASINFEDPNPYISFTDSPVYVNDKLRNWVSEGPRRAGVSCFGFSGTNSHILLEEYIKEPQPGHSQAQPYLFPISAKSEESLRQTTDALSDWLIDNEEVDLSLISSTLAKGRGHYEYRLAIIASDSKELKNKLSMAKLNDYKETEHIFINKHKIVGENKEEKGKGELTAFDISQMSKKAEICINNLVNDAENGNGQMKELAKLYTDGAHIDWNCLYEKEMCKVNIPGYRFKRERHWIDPVIKRKGRKNENTIGSSLLLEECLAESLEQNIYQTEFQVDKHWVLSEHRIKNNSILPGTAYIEMALQAAKRYYGSNGIVLKDFLLLSPMVVAEGKTSVVQTILKKDGDFTSIIIAGREQGENAQQWTRYAVCKVEKAEGSGGILDISSLCRRCSDEIVRLDYDSSTEVYYMGARWNNMYEAHIGKDKLLLELILPDRFKNELEDYITYPSLLDNAVNIAIRKIGEGIYLPFAYGKLTIYNTMPGQFYSYLRTVKEVRKNDEAVSFQIILADKDGNIFAEIEDYTIKKMNEDVLSKEPDTYYRMQWKERGKIVDKSEILHFTEEEKFIILADRTPSSEAYIDELNRLVPDNMILYREAAIQKDGENHNTVGCIQSDYDKLIGRMESEGISRIIYILGAKDKGNTEPDAAEDMKELQHIFYLSKSLLSIKQRNKIQIGIFTEYAYSISGQERVIPVHAAVLDFSRVLQTEVPNLVFHCMDTDRETDRKAILHDFINGRGIRRTAYRRNKAYEEIIERAVNNRSNENTLPIKDGGIYIITGGTGGIGFLLTQSLALKDNVTICIISRHGLTEKHSEKYLELLERIKNSGSEIKFYKADVGSQNQMESVIDTIRELGKISGIIHCAGVAGDGYVLNKNVETFTEVLAPKVAGICLLDRLTRQDKPDFFVSCSSYVTLLPLPGQTDYTAANAYLNAYTRYQREEGIPAYSINWPGWKETGMASERGIENSLLCQSIENAKGLRYFDYILTNGEFDVVYPISLDYEFLLSVQDNLDIHLGTDIMQSLESYKSTATAKGEQKTSLVKEKIKLSGRNNGVYSKTEETLAGLWGSTLNISEIDIYDSFNNLGGNSLLATKLFQVLEVEYGQQLHITDIFTYPSVAQMSEYIETVLGKADVEEAEKSEKTDSELTEKEPLDENQTDDELLAMIRRIKSEDISVEVGLDFLDGEMKNE